MDINKQKEALYKLGAFDDDIDELISYTKNAFILFDNSDNNKNSNRSKNGDNNKNSDRSKNGDNNKNGENSKNDDFIMKWKSIIKTASKDGVATAINRYLVKEELNIKFMMPDTLKIELFPSIGGPIPVITTENIKDYENMICNITNKGKEVPNISEMGASFVYGKINRFIILSNKPYSTVSAACMELDEKVWREKSMIIRKHHECTHYYTKRYYNTARNNLHDELIADFNGLYAAFGEYRAEWFLKFLGLSKDSYELNGRIKVYTSGLSKTAVKIIEKLAKISAAGVEEWTKSDEFLQMSDIERIRFLCEKELLEYVK